MEIIGPFLICLIAGLSTVLGFLFIFIKPKDKVSFIGSSLAFSATIMLLISIVELIPEGYIHLNNRYNLFYASITLILMLIIGNFISKGINKYIKKQEKINSDLYRVGIISMIVLMIHNLPEGIITFLASTVDIKTGIHLAVAIMMHNIPEGIAIAIPIYYATKEKKKAFKATFLSGLSEPVGGVIAFIFLYKFINNTMISVILLFTAGLMISVAINEVYNEANKYPRRSILIGVVLASLLFIINQLLFH